MLIKITTGRGHQVNNKLKVVEKDQILLTTAAISTINLLQVVWQGSRITAMAPIIQLSIIIKTVHPINSYNKTATIRVIWVKIHTAQQLSSKNEIINSNKLRKVNWMENMGQEWLGWSKAITPMKDHPDTLTQGGNMGKKVEVGRCMGNQAEKSYEETTGKNKTKSHHKIQGTGLAAMAA